MKQAFFRLVAFFILLPSFASAGLPSIIDSEEFKDVTATLRRVADRKWLTHFICEPEAVRLVVIKNPPQENGVYSAEPTPGVLLLYLNGLPRMEACDVQHFLFEDMKPIVTYLRSCKHLTTLRIANQTWDQSEMAALSTLPLRALEFSNSTLSVENAVPLPETLESFSYQVRPYLPTQTPYNPMCSKFFQETKELGTIHFNYPDAWIKFWTHSSSLQNAPLKQLHLKQPSAWEQCSKTSYLIHNSLLGPCPTALSSRILFKYFKHLEIFSFYEYTPRLKQAAYHPNPLKGLLYTKSEKQWSFFGWPDAPDSDAVAQSSCFDQWEGKLEELRETFPEAQFCFSDMGPKITEKLQTMQQQEGWKDKIQFKSPFSPIAPVSGALPEWILVNFWKNQTFNGLTFGGIVNHMVEHHPDILWTPEENKPLSEEIKNNFGLVSESQQKQWISLTFGKSFLRTRAIQVIRETLGSESPDEEMLALSYNGS